MQYARLAQQPPINAVPFGIRRNPESTRRYAMEQSNADMNRLIALRDFNSDKEVSDFVQAASVFQSVKMVEERRREPTTDSRQARFEDVLIDISQRYEHLFPEISELWEQVEKNKSDSERAQDLMYKAWRSDSSSRFELARQALEVCADCTDAYVLFAQEAAGSLKEARDFFEKGVQASERLLGENMLEKGGCWARLETRPYMRARAGLAGVLWLLGERASAIEHMRELLRLNPGDNQGLRYQLVNWYFEESRDEEAKKLLDQFSGEESATWRFSEALLQFRTTGGEKRARIKLKEALQINQHVPRFLLGEKQLPDTMPEYVGMGDEEEAIEYAMLAENGWSVTPGALDWLRETSADIAAMKRRPAYKLWKTNMDSASRLIEEEKLSWAKGQLQYALKQADKLGEDDYTCMTLMRLSALIVRTGGASENETIFLRLLSVTESLYDKDDITFAFALLYWGSFQMEIGKLPEAELTLNRAAEICRQYGNGGLSAIICMTQAAVHRMQGKQQLANEYMDRAHLLTSGNDGEYADLLSTRS